MRLDEQAAIDVICGVAAVVSWERLVPSGSVPTPDFRIELVDGRFADVEVTMYTDGAARSFQHQLSEERDGEGKAGNGRYARIWEFGDLSYSWEVAISDLTPSQNSRDPAWKFVQEVKDLFVEIEGSALVPEEMRRRASDELDRRLWWAENATSGGAAARDAFVLKPPKRVGLGRGSILTHAVVGESTFGEDRAVRLAISECSDRKAARAQLSDAQGERWLVVVLDRPAAASEFHEFFGVEAAEPYRDLTDLIHNYFDELWVVARTSRPPVYVALRLIKSGRRQERHVVEKARD